MTTFGIEIACSFGKSIFILFTDDAWWLRSSFKTCLELYFKYSSIRQIYDIFQSFIWSYVEPFVILIIDFNEMFIYSCFFWDLNES